MVETKEIIDVTGVKLVATGTCLSRSPKGEIAFVDRLLPGENAQVEVISRKSKVIFGEIVKLENISESRIDPECVFYKKGCGGCSWQHIDVGAQPGFKTEIISDSLSRIAKLEDISQVMRDIVVLEPSRYRTSARVLANGQQWGFRRAKSNDFIPVTNCMVLHDELLMQASDVVSAISASEDDGSDLHEAQIRRSPDPLYGRALNVSKDSFFQSHIDAPKILTEMVLSFIDDIGKDKSLNCVDLYSGVGIFALALASNGHRVLSVEGSVDAIKDARSNLDDLDVEIIESDVREFNFESQNFLDSCDVVVADPSRDGLKSKGVESVLSCDADKIILISCDPASGARDIRSLIDNGYNLDSVTPIDMFGYNHHVEMVSVLTK